MNLRQAKKFLLLLFIFNLDENSIVEEEKNIKNASYAIPHSFVNCEKMQFNVYDVYIHLFLFTYTTQTT